ncbi:MAG: hypothetical protein GX442_00580 [Candidatus Riflebacteria bacterium]|nr:hypothetical protein [Candidatus Riflebacteria bacterium]
MLNEGPSGNPFLLAAGFAVAIVVVVGLAFSLLRTPGGGRSRTGTVDGDSGGGLLGGGVPVPYSASGTLAPLGGPSDLAPRKPGMAELPLLFDNNSTPYSAVVRHRLPPEFFTPLPADATRVALDTLRDLQSAKNEAERTRPGPRPPGTPPEKSGP